MKKFFKVLSTFGLLAASVIFAFVIYGIKSIPDSIHLVSDEKLKFNEIYSYRISSGDVSVSVNSENAAKGTLLSEYTVDISALKVIPVKSADVIVSERKYVIPSGDVFGIRKALWLSVLMMSIQKKEFQIPLKQRALMPGI